MSVIHGLRLALGGVTAMAAVCCAATVPAAAAAPEEDTPQTASIVLSGTVSDARAQKVDNGVITPPTFMPAVSGARIEVNGALVGRTDGAGGFTIDYPDPTGEAVTVTVKAPGFGTFQLAGLTPANSGDSLTVQLTNRSQSMTGRGASLEAPRAKAGVAPAASAPSGAAPTGAAPSAMSPSAVAPLTEAPSALTTGNCGGYASDSTPPSSIRVLQYAQHTSTGAPVAGTQTGVVNVPFNSYVKDVLPGEWITSWQPDSLKAGAMAAKTYAWYWVNNWRGGSSNGTCYNVDDSINYQRYIPGRATATTNAAVDATWNSVMTRNGSIFQASYQATLTGNTSESCGSGLSRYPNTLSQWGSQNCALAGQSWQSILSTYYPGLSIGSGSTGGSPAPSSPVSMDANATHVAFVDTNNNVANDWVAN
ncbi:SpoIID/LytB domain-containing protein, partial [Kitasatospora sp. NPDC001527]|uniref:SpoIID/LytB domain-containing protein n=1 Tax=Kitasatospora sp. NPDC001527 TaxID=3154519 RepID=UPI003326013F